MSCLTELSHVASEPRVLRGGIQELLHWAFAVEFAQLDFQDGLGAPRRCGTEFVLMERAALGGFRLDNGAGDWVAGVSVDGGGRSDPHPDADMVAALLSKLPLARGGRGMALRLVELARVRADEYWMQDAVPRCEPCGWHENQFGRFARTEVIPNGHPVWSTAQRSRISRKGKPVIEPKRWCPIVYRDTAYEQSEARRSYLRWWGALLFLRDELKTYGLLDRWTLTRDLPPKAPWEKGA